MKRRLSSLLAGVLLASFLAGGGVAPTLHRVQHAQEQYAAQQAHCTHGVHDAPAAEQDRAQLGLERCWLCVRHVLGVPAFPGECTAAFQPDVPLHASTAAFRTSRFHGRFVIRGPPRG